MAKKSGILLSLVVLGLLVLIAVLQFKSQAVTAQLRSITEHLDTMQAGQPTKDQKTADAIVAEVRLLIDIPEDINPTVATIIDVDLLRGQNSFYDKAENGDFLIVTPNRAILYSQKEKRILDVVAVTLEPVKEGSSAE